MPGKLLHFAAGGGAVSERTNEDLVAACGRGDRGALGLLFERLSPGVYRFLSRLCGADTPELDDLVQMTFLEVWRSAAAFRGASSAQTWVYAVAANVGRHFRRGEGRRRQMAVRFSQKPVAEPHSPERNTAQREQIARLDAAVATLPAELRIPFLMVYVEELTGAEVAKALGIPDGTLWRRLYVARQRLWQKLQEEPPESRELSVASRAISRLFGKR